jgi:hypothetical protein
VEPDEAGQVAADALSVPDVPEVELWSGDALVPEEANAIVASGCARTILLAGEAESGKTTLLAAVFEQYLKGPYAGLRFRESRTLAALEERCFLARVASGRSKSTTKRTTLTDEPRIIHLQLQSQGDRRNHDLLAVDIAGERFTAARNNNDAWAEISVLKTVDRIVFLLDGARIADPKTRQETISATRQLVRSALEAGVASSEIADVAVTKWDLVVGAGDAAVKAAETALERFGDVLDRDAGSFIKTSARSEVDEVDAGFGLEALLQRWLEESQRPPLPSRIDPPNLGDPFERFGSAARNDVDR